MLGLLLCFVAFVSIVVVIARTLFSYPLPDDILELWGIFRSTGRFSWIAVYIITAAVIAFTERNDKVVGRCLIFFALAIQLIDLYPFSRNSHEIVDYGSPFVRSVWDEFSGYSHIYMDKGARNQFQYAIAQYAFDRNADINHFYFARPPKDMLYPIELSADTLYSFSSA